MNTINGQCDNGTNYYPASPFSSTYNAWSYASTNNWAGEVIQINARIGFDYIFSTCGTYGGITAGYDTQLTLYDDRGVVVAYNDDYSGCSLQSVINYTALYDGTYYLHLTEFDCISNQESTQIMIFCTPATAPVLCANLDYVQDFETGVTHMTTTAGTQANASLDATAANGSAYGLHMEGNTSSSWYTPYNTGPDAFSSSPNHIVSVARDICASIDPALTLMFDKMQTYTWNPNYCWFRVTIDGIPIPDQNGNIYFNGSNNTWEQMKYDLSAYANTPFTVAFESCAKYYTGYTSTGMGGDAVYIDNISITQAAGLSPPTTPGTISGFDLPNNGGTETYTISPVNGASSYTWTIPSGWSILADNGTSITVKTSNTDGNVAVYATNAAGNSSPQTLAVTTIEAVSSYPYSTAFENETNDVATASVTGFTFNETGWRNVGGDDGDWRTDAGGTSSTNSGPGAGASSGQSDHYPGTSSGKYIYTEASTPMYPSKTFYLWSPPYNLTSLNVPTLTFWYSLYSTSGTSLSIQSSTDNGASWSSDIAFMCPTVSQSAEVSGNMGSTWRQGFVDLDSYNANQNIMFRFTVVTGTSWDGDVCLDDIKVVDAQNTSVDVGENISLGANSYSMAYGLVLNGTSAQTITSNGYNISNITINNSNGVTISGDLKIDGILTLTSGVITTGNDIIITAATPTGAISGGSNTSFINGNLRRYISSGTGTYAFPIGNGTGTGNYQRVDLINGNLAGVSYIDASTSDMPSGNYNELTATQLGSELVEVFDKQWQLTPNTTPTGGTYGVNLYLNGVSGGFMQDDNFTIVKRDGTSNTWADWDTYEASTTIPAAGQPGRTLSSGYGQKSGFSSFSLFGFGGTGGSALPITLVSWGGGMVDDVAVLEWTVASQVNNDFYTIEKGIDCENWEKVATIPGAGNSNMLMDYKICDENPYVGVSYYRLTQTDYDGKFETFKPISIIYDKPIKLSINPNPVEDKLNLYLGENLRGMTNVTIVNSRGQVIYKKSFLGEYKMINLQVGEYRRGYYLLEVDHNQRIGTLKFIKE